MASDATKVPVRGNIHMDTRVNEVPDVNSEVKLKFEAIEAIQSPWRPQRPLKWLLWEESQVEHHKLISQCPCCPLVHSAL